MNIDESSKKIPTRMIINPEYFLIWGVRIATFCKNFSLADPTKREMMNIKSNIVMEKMRKANNAE